MPPVISSVASAASPPTSGRRGRRRERHARRARGVDWRRARMTGLQPALLRDQRGPRLVGGDEAGERLRQRGPADSIAPVARGSSHPSALSALGTERHAPAATRKPWRRQSASARSAWSTGTSSPTPKSPRVPSSAWRIVSERQASAIPGGRPCRLPGPNVRSRSGRTTRPPSTTVRSARPRTTGPASGGRATSQTIVPGEIGSASRIGRAAPVADSTRSQPTDERSVGAWPVRARRLRRARAAQRRERRGIAVRASDQHELPRALARREPGHERADRPTRAQHRDAGIGDREAARRELGARRLERGRRRQRVAGGDRHARVR